MSEELISKLEEKIAELEKENKEFKFLLSQELYDVIDWAKSILDNLSTPTNKDTE